MVVSERAVMARGKWPRGTTMVHLEVETRWSKRVTAKTFDGGCGARDPVLEDFGDFVIAASDWLEMRGNGDVGRARTAL